MKNITLVIWLIATVSISFAQQNETDTTKQLYVVTTHTSIEYIGYILSDDGREILIETESLGKIYIPKSEIRSIVKVDSHKEIVHGEFRASGPFTTRYAFTTNALPIKKGENYALINLYGPEVHFAVSDNLNIGVMSTWIASPMILAIKYSVKTKNEKLNFSAGALLGTSGYLNTFKGYGGLYFLNATFGSRKKNITFSAGFGHVNLGFEEDVAAEGTYTTDKEYFDLFYDPNVTINKESPSILGPLFSIAGIAPVGAKASFVFDSMFGFFSSTDYNQVTTITIQEPDFVNPGIYEHTVRHNKTSQLAMFLMPGMRFQTKENRAFQISLAGVSVFRLNGFPENTDPNFSFPMPMCTWFFRF